MADKLIDFNALKGPGDLHILQKRVPLLLRQRKNEVLSNYNDFSISKLQVIYDLSQLVKSQINDLVEKQSAVAKAEEELNITYERTAADVKDYRQKLDEILEEEKAKINILKDDIELIENDIKKSSEKNTKTLEVLNALKVIAKTFDKSLGTSIRMNDDDINSFDLIFKNGTKDLCINMEFLPPQNFNVINVPFEINHLFEKYKEHKNLIEFLSGIRQYIFNKN